MLEDEVERNIDLRMLLCSHLRKPEALAKTLFTSYANKIVLVHTGHKRDFAFHMADDAEKQLWVSIAKQLVNFYGRSCNDASR